MSYPVFTECHETGVGEAANDLWLHTRIAALNLRRLVNLGLHRPHAAWTLATPPV